jgi:hypothetical protein
LFTASSVKTEAATTLGRSMYPHDIEQRIKDAKDARMEFMRKNRRYFCYGYGLLGLLCAFLTVSAVESAKRDQQASTAHAQISHATKVH